MQIAIYGIGGFGREVAELAKRAFSTQTANVTGRPADRPSEIVFVDDAADSPSTVNGLPVLSFDDAKLLRYPVVVAIANGETRKRVEDRCRDGKLEIRTVVSATATLTEFGSLGPGSIITDYSVISTNTQIGRSFHSNVYSYVAHDCVIGDYVTFGPRVCCCGNVHVGDMAYVGAGASIIQGTKDEPLVVGAGSVIAMGAVVTKSVEPYTVVAGTPARVIKSLR